MNVMSKKIVIAVSIALIAIAGLVLQFFFPLSISFNFEDEALLDEYIGHLKDEKICYELSHRATGYWVKICENDEVAYAESKYEEIIKSTWPAEGKITEE